MYDFYWIYFVNNEVEVKIWNEINLFDMKYG